MECQKQKRVCKAPYKKWTESEMEKLLAYLKENRPMEKPNAQSYYRRYLEENCIDSEWKHVRCKVKNMRLAYNAAKATQNSIGSGALNNGETMQSVILKRCPKFFEYEEVFGYKEDRFNADVVDTGFGEISAQSATEFTFQTDSAMESQFEDHSSVAVEPEIAIEVSCEDFNQKVPPTVADSVQKTANHEHKSIYSRTGLTDVLQVQSEILSMRKANKETELKLKETELELQKEKFLYQKEKEAKELELQKERLLFEREKHQNESTRIDKQLQMERKLRIMEIRMKKEIALREIEMKERIEMEKLKNTK